MHTAKLNSAATRFCIFHLYIFCSSLLSCFFQLSAVLNDITVICALLISVLFTTYNS